MNRFFSVCLLVLAVALFFAPVFAVAQQEESAGELNAVAVGTTAVPAPAQVEATTATAEPTPVKEPEAVKTTGEAAVSEPVPAAQPEQVVKPASQESITFVMYADFQCPFCKRFYENTLPELKQKYGGRLELEFKHFPLAFHSNAEIAAEASECAREQGKFFEYAEVLFENSPNLEKSLLESYAVQVGLNEKQFEECLSEGSVKETVKKNYEEGLALGVQGTPTFFINGGMVAGAQEVQVFVDAIENGVVQEAPVKQPTPSKYPVEEKTEPEEEQVAEAGDGAAEEIVGLLIKTEGLSIKFQLMAEKSRALANYYGGGRNPQKQAVWNSVAEDFEALSAKLDGIKTSIKENGYKLDKETAAMIRETIREVKTGTEQIARTIIEG